MSIKIEVIENEKPDLPVCKMKCDEFLCDWLNNYELTKFFNKSSINMFVGKMGSGKSSLLYSMFKGRGKKKLFRKVWDNMYLFRPKASGHSMKDDIFDENIEEERKFNELTAENLQTVYEDISENYEDTNSVIIIDDCGAYLKNADNVEWFKEIIYNHRHYHITIFFLCQSYLSVCKEIRKLFTNIIIFKCSRQEMEYLFQEHIESKRDALLPIMKYVYDKKHQWLFLNTETQRTFKMWDEFKIIIDDDVD